MQITHEQAHKLIQLNIDKALSSQETSVLSAHLQNCRDCQAYANEMTEVQRVLFPMLKRQWARQPIPLSLPALVEGNSRSQGSKFLTTRTAAIGLVVVTLFFSIWQFVLTGPSISVQLPLVVAPVPTPSAHRTISTSTLITLENCETVSYIVQEDDTLAGIATRFSVLKEDIMALNALKSETVIPSEGLLIPICHLTPTGTVHPATFTTTYTPILNPITATPGG